MSCKFSIVIPVYNGEKFIGRAIDSVLRQTYSNWELIVVNDGSVDQTMKVIKRYSEKDSRIMFVNRFDNSRRPAVARNIGIGQSTGKYISFLDADDVFYPEKLYEVEKFFEDNPGTDLVCHGERYLMGDKVLKFQYYGPYTTYEDLLFKSNVLSTSAVVLKKDILNDIGPLTENLAFRGVEDYDLWLRFSRVGKIGYLYKILGDCIIRPGSVSAHKLDHYKAQLDLIGYHFSHWPNKSFYFRFLIAKRKLELRFLYLMEYLRDR